jgi:hypothetical protein
LTCSSSAQAAERPISNANAAVLVANAATLPHFPFAITTPTCRSGAVVRPHSVKGFSSWFARKCREAGLKAGFTAQADESSARQVQTGLVDHPGGALLAESQSSYRTLFDGKLAMKPI